MSWLFSGFSSLNRTICTNLLIRLDHVIILPEIFSFRASINHPRHSFITGKIVGGTSNYRNLRICRNLPFFDFCITPFMTRVWNAFNSRKHIWRIYGNVYGMCQNILWGELQLPKSVWTKTRTCVTIHRNATHTFRSYRFSIGIFCHFWFINHRVLFMFTVKTLFYDCLKISPR